MGAGHLIGSNDRTVLLLGAGFSRSISNDMPLTDELGRAALQRIGAPVSENSWTFESELSRLAEDQPDLNQAENLANRSQFVRLSAAVADVLLDRQQATLAEPCPEWLLRLVAVLQARRATTITFNYDEFIEYAVMAHLLTDWATGERVIASDPLDHLPPLPPSTYGDHARSAFQLLKLHGSLSWWWSPGDSTAATLNRWRFTSGFGSASPDDGEAERRRLLPGRERFIVPPTALKSSYYTNPFTRELWRRAGQALASATQVCLVGYSLPVTDLVVGGMLRHWLTGNATPLVVVNPDPDPVIDQLHRLGFIANPLEVIEGDEAVPSFASQFGHSTSVELSTRLGTEEPSDDPVFIAWSRDRAVAVIDVRNDGDETVLVGEAVDPGTNPFRPRHGTDREPLTHRRLLASVQSGRPLAWTLGDGRPNALVDTAVIHRETGIAARCRALVPSDPPPL